jgi:endonuclease III
MARIKRPFDISRVLDTLAAEAPAWGVTTIDAEANDGANPFRILIGTVISQRTKDEVTAAATRRLFARARTPRGMLRLGEEEIDRLIFPAGFRHTKARTIPEICRALLDRFGGEVPADIEAMTTLPGVGRKTANLVMTHGFREDAICVDVHVHRIVNRLGHVRTRTPDETEMRLRAKLPRRHWRSINGLLVAFGQNVCRPVSPHCSRCPVVEDCRRIGVGRSR